MTFTAQGATHAQFAVDLPCRIIVIEHHLCARQTLRCHVRAISLQGAVLDLFVPHPVPPHFFLEIIGIHDEIGCTLIRRQQESVVVCFNMLLDADFVAQLVQASGKAGR